MCECVRVCACVFEGRGVGVVNNSIVFFLMNFYEYIYFYLKTLFDDVTNGSFKGLLPPAPIYN